MKDYIRIPVANRVIADLKFARAKGALEPEGIKEKFPDSRKIVVEEKYDGSRFMLVARGKTVQLRSRHVSTKTGELGDKTANFPHLQKLEGWFVLDGEILPSGGESFSDVGSVVLSLPAKAIAWQKKHGLAAYYAFDILVYNNVDVRSQTFEKRRKLLEKTVQYIHKSCHNDHVVMPAQWPGKDAVGKFNHIVEFAGEGVMVKELDAPYGQGWYKVKKHRDACVLISGFTEGQGKYKNKIGAIRFSVLDEATGKLLEVGQCSGMDDATRDYMSLKPAKYIGKVLEVRAQEIAAKGRLRHPRFVRIRHDYNKKECTLQKLYDDFSS